MVRSLLATYRDERRTLALVAGLSLLSAGSEAVALGLLAVLIKAASDGDADSIQQIGVVDVTLSITDVALLAGLMMVLALAITSTTSFVTSRLVSSYRLRARLNVVDAFSAAEWEVQSSERDGWLLTLGTENIDVASSGLRFLASWLRGAIGVCVFLVVAVIASATAVLTISAILLVLVFGLRPINRYARRVATIQAGNNVTLNQEFISLTDAAREFQVYGVGSSASQAYRSTARVDRSLVFRAEFVQSITSPVFRTVGSLLIIGLVAVSASRSDAALATVGLVAVLLYRSFNYGTVLVSVHQQLIQLVPFVDQLAEGISKLDSGARTEGTVDVGKVTSIELVDVGYTYPGGDSASLRGVSLTLSVGEILGIVGPSGAGKTTLAELLLGLRTPTEGVVRLNDVDLADVRTEVKSSAVALLSQSVPIIPGSIHDNIRFFRDLDDEAVRRASEAAQLADVLIGLPHGLATIIGPGARSVSGGQAQRIGLARAIAGTPAFVVLDEPTSALDIVTEEAVTDGIDTLRGTAGVVIIAHRLSTLRRCDRIAVIESGRLSDVGVPEVVRSRNPFLAQAFAVGQLDWKSTSGSEHDAELTESSI